MTERDLAHKPEGSKGELSSLSRERVIEVANLATDLLRHEGIEKVNLARQRGLLRSHLAHWEMAELFRYCLPLAVHDALAVADFAAFNALWLPLVGEDAAGWLPSLYLAAVASPACEAACRAPLIGSAMDYFEAYD